MGRDREVHEPPEKTCVVCGRRIQWRAKWARDWEAVRYCSDDCRRTGLTDADRGYERDILALLATRAATATICPSDVARRTAEDWRPLMEPVRRAARRLVVAGEVEIVQHGSVVDPSSAKGPIRIRRVRRA